jgi:predicted dithiol-disulfide oxidoreductase (DUF899 family)
MTAAALPPVVDAGTWQHQLDALRAREKAATRELDAIAAQRRRLPMVKMPDYTLEGEQGPVRLADVFGGKSQLIVYNHMWFPGEHWQCRAARGSPRSSAGWSSWTATTPGSSSSPRAPSARHWRTGGGSGTR